MNCSICDEDILTPAPGRAWPTHCSECGSSFEFDAELCGEDWKSSVSCTPAWRVTRHDVLACWKWSIARVGSRWSLFFDGEPDGSYSTLREASAAARVGREVTA